MMKKIIAFLLVTAFFGSFSFAQRVPVKNVAVVETQINERSGVASEINRAEVDEITNEIRREAVNNLPRGRFNVMTSETVLSMGDAVLEDCAEENCVIALGSKIGADYIVRGIISKFRDNFTVTIEMYETEYGMLVATAAPVRTADVNELLEKTTVVCAEMYKKFLETSSMVSPQVAPIPVSVPKSEPRPKPQHTLTPKPAPAVEQPRTVTSSQMSWMTPEERQRWDHAPVDSVNKKNNRWYLGLRYLTAPSHSYWYGGNLELGRVWHNGMFLGVDFGAVGEGDGGNSTVGLGLNCGGVHELTSELKLIYGLSGGYWHTNYGYPFDLNDYLFGGPFGRLRYKYLELSYRILIGNKSNNKYDATDEAGNSLGLTIIDNEIKFSHQLGLGLYFEF